MHQSQHAYTGQKSLQYPLFVRSGRLTAELWLQSALLSLASFRDLGFRNLVAGLGHLDDLPGRTRAFNDAYADRIAQEIAGEVRHD